MCHVGPNVRWAHTCARYSVFVAMDNIIVCCFRQDAQVEESTLSAICGPAFMNEREESGCPPSTPFGLEHPLNTQNDK